MSSLIELPSFALRLIINESCDLLSISSDILEAPDDSYEQDFEYDEKVYKIKEKIEIDFLEQGIDIESQKYLLEFEEYVSNLLSN